VKKHMNEAGAGNFEEAAVEPGRGSEMSPDSA
jgi:hypothetical protein